MENVQRKNGTIQSRTQIYLYIHNRHRKGEWKRLKSGRRFDEKPENQEEERRQWDLEECLILED